MSNNSTLNSRLRELFNKAYRAEKLHHTRKSSAIVDGFEHSKLQELAQNVNANAWSITNAELKNSLNKLLRDNNSINVINELNTLKEKINAEIAEKAKEQERLKNMLIKMTEYTEFYNTLKLSLDLVKIKSTTQALQATIGELNYVMGSNANRSSNKLETETQMNELPSNVHVLNFHRKVV